MSDIKRATDDLMKWAAEVADKANCSVTKVIIEFTNENNNLHSTIENSKKITAKRLINGGNTNES